MGRDRILSYSRRTAAPPDQDTIRRLLDELHNIYLACQGAADLTLFPQLKRGRQVRVLRGLLAGVYGRISKRKEALRLVLKRFKNDGMVTWRGTELLKKLDDGVEGGRKASAFSLQDDEW
mgnify:CR=1 FL=1